jgi:hypothetical protein
MFNAQCVPYVPAGSTFNSAKFCPYRVFVCFVWVWEQTTIVPFFGINWLVVIERQFITALFTISE